MGALEAVALIGPWVTATAAIGALIVGILTINQRFAADRREHWWKRAQWAFNLAMSGDSPEEKEVGLRVLRYLNRSRLTHRDEARLISAVSAVVLRDEKEVAGQ